MGMEGTCLLVNRCGLLSQESQQWDSTRVGSPGGMRAQFQELLSWSVRAEKS